MKKPKVNFDHKYVKACSYAAITVIITVLVIYLIYASSGLFNTLWSLFVAVIKPVIIGGIICYLLNPLVKKLERGLRDRGFEKIARSGAVAISIFLAAAVIFGILGILVFTLFRTVSTINISGFKDLLQYIQTDFSSFSQSLEEYLGMFGLSASTISKIASAIVNGISSIASGTLFGVIFAIYFLLDGKSIGTYWLHAIRVISGKQSSASLRQFLDDADRVFSGYIRGQFIDAAIIGVMTTIAMLLIGVPNGTVVGILTGCGNLIPYVGPIVGYLTLALVCIPAAAWGKLVAGAVALAVMLFVDGNIINPKLLSSNVMVHPLLVVAALLGGGAIGGILGMLVAVPVAALLKIQFDRYIARREAREAEKAASEEAAKRLTEYESDEVPQ